MLDLHLFFGLRLLNEVDESTGYDEKAVYYGSFPREQLENECEHVKRVMSRAQLDKQFEVSERAYLQYNKTREGASTASAVRAKQLPPPKLHPLFAREVDEASRGVERFLEGIRSFKGSGTIFEVKQLNMKSGSDAMKIKRAMHDRAIALREEQAARDEQNAKLAEQTKINYASKKIDRSDHPDYDHALDDDQAGEDDEDEDDEDELDDEEEQSGDEAEEEDEEMDGEMDEDADDAEDDEEEMEGAEEDEEDQPPARVAGQKRKADSSSASSAAADGKGRLSRAARKKLKSANGSARAAASDSDSSPSPTRRSAHAAAAARPQPSLSASSSTGLSFRDPNFFLSAEPSETDRAREAGLSLGEGGRGRLEDLVMDVTGDDEAGFARARAVHTWDQRRRKYVRTVVGGDPFKKQRNEAGELIRAKDQPALFEQWKKKHKLGAGSVGRSIHADDDNDMDGGAGDGEDDDGDRPRRGSSSGRGRGGSRGGGRGGGRGGASGRGGGRDSTSSSKKKGGSSGGGQSELRTAAEIRKSRLQREKNKIKNQRGGFKAAAKAAGRGGRGGGGRGGGGRGGGGRMSGGGSGSRGRGGARRGKR